MTCLADDSERQAAFSAARDMCRREGGHGYLASFFLPREKREAIYALWGFARLLQQAVAAGKETDCCSGAGSVRPLLVAHVEAIYAGEVQAPLPQFRDPTHWTMLAAADAARRFEVPRQLWLDLIEGLAADNGVQRVATWHSLESRLNATGGSAARIFSAVMGATHSEAGTFASAIGRAAQLTGILRNLQHDVAHNRLLLPLEDLTRSGYSERMMLARTVNDNFYSLLQYEIERARTLFAQGASGACWLAGDGSRMAAASFISLQLGTLDEMKRHPEKIFHEQRSGKRAAIGAQLRSLPRAWRIARRQAADPMPSLR